MGSNAEAVTRDREVRRSESGDLIASQSSKPALTRSGRSERLLRLVVGASVFSGLTLGLGLTATHLINTESGVSVPAISPAQEKFFSPSAETSVLPVKASLGSQALGARAQAAAPLLGIQAKAERVNFRSASESRAEQKPLSTDAFDRRFVAPFSASALASPRRAASHLLASAQAGDVRSVFGLRDANALETARAFRFPEAPMVAEAKPKAPAPTLVALAAPEPLPRILDIDPAPAPERLSDKKTGEAKPAKIVPQKIDPRGGGKKLEQAGQVELPAFSARGALRPGKSAKAPVVAAIPDKPAAPKHKSFFEALGFAKPDNPDEDRPSRNSSIPWPGTGKRVAIYDISAQRVYMPSGESMEAHSGQGKLRDDPAYVNVKMRGPTPPSTYRLSRREALFHGVEALRMTPVNGVNPHGRVGLLTHSYLRRVPGDSAGCVVFKDYPRFLKAFKRGEVDHIVVVSSMGKAKALTTKVASMFSR